MEALLLLMSQLKKDKSFEIVILANGFSFA